MAAFITGKLLFIALLLLIITAVKNTGLFGQAVRGQGSASLPLLCPFSVPLSSYPGFYSVSAADDSKAR